MEHFGHLTRPKISSKLDGDKISTTHNCFGQCIAGSNCDSRRVHFIQRLQQFVALGLLIARRLRHLRHALQHTLQRAIWVIILKPRQYSGAYTHAFFM